MIDTHCHLNLADAFPDMDAAVSAALDAGVEAMVVVGIEREANDKAIALAEKYSCVWATVGWHPTSAAAFNDAELKRLEESLKHPRVIALGEVGLDYYWDKATKEEQFRCLEAQLEVARSVRKPMRPNPHAGLSLEGAASCLWRPLPVVFHCRDAYPDLLDFLDKRRPDRFVLHCFAGDDEDARRAAELGAYIGVDGPITYKKNGRLREIVASYPRERIVIETDAPFLSPEPFRGKPNSPSRLGWICRAVGGTLGIAEEEADRLTTENAKRLFGL